MQGSLFYDPITWNVVFFDFETTGLNRQEDRVIEIGAIKARYFKSNNTIEKTGEFHSFINADNIPDNIIRITGITPDMLKSAPDEMGVFKRFIEFINDSILISHNIDFDYIFLKNTAKRLFNLDIRNPAICTLLLSRKLIPAKNVNGYSLENLARYFSISSNRFHRAIDDSLVCMQLFIYLMEIYKRDYNTMPTLQELIRFQGIT